MNKTCDDLLVIYKDGTKNTISNVEDWGYNNNDGTIIFFYTKNGRKGFIPSGVAKFIGRSQDYGV